MSLSWRNTWKKLTGDSSDRRGAARWAELAAARAPLAVTAALSLAVAAQAADIAIDLIRDSAAAAPAQSAAVRTGRDGARFTALANTLGNIEAAHLFGKPPPVVTAGSTAASRAPLVLTGIIATGDPEDGFAILGNSPATTRVYATGAQAAPGITLLEVHPQWVVVLRGEERLTLRLPRERAAAVGENAAVASTLPQTRSFEVADSGGDPVQHAPGEPPKPPPVSDAYTLIRAFSLRPVSIDGQRGVRVMGADSATASLGLSPGDVITEINGVPIGGKNTPDLAAALKEGGATLTIDRNGEATSVTIDPATAANAANAYRASTPDL